MRLKKGFVLRDVCGEKVVMGEGLASVNFGKLLVLNEPTVWLWQQAVEMGDFTIDTLAAKLCDEYEVTFDEARADVAEIVDEWQKMEMTE